MNAVQSALPGVVAMASSTNSIPTAVVSNGSEYRASLVGVTEAFQAIRNLMILQGRFLDSVDMRSRSKVCLITEELARVAFPNADPVGSSLRAGELSFTVVGVFRERGINLRLVEIQRYTMLVPFPLMHYYSGDDSVGVLYAQTASPEYVIPLTRQVEELLHNRHPGGTYVVENLGGVLNAARTISTALTIVLLLVGGLVLLVSGIGIMNIMLVTVTERTREIGVRKAIGARRSEILYQFLIEAGVISGVGSLLRHYDRPGHSGAGAAAASRRSASARTVDIGGAGLSLWLARSACSSATCRPTGPLSFRPPNRCATSSCGRRALGPLESSTHRPIHIPIKRGEQ